MNGSKHTVDPEDEGCRIGYITCIIMIIIVTVVHKKKYLAM